MQSAIVLRHFIGPLRFVGWCILTGTATYVLLLASHWRRLAVQPPCALEIVPKVGALTFALQAMPWVAHAWLLLAAITWGIRRIGGTSPARVDFLLWVGCGLSILGWYAVTWATANVGVYECLPF
jgi:hypothetical protein